MTLTRPDDHLAEPFRSALRRELVDHASVGGVEASRRPGAPRGRRRIVWATALTAACAVAAAVGWAALVPERPTGDSAPVAPPAVSATPPPVPTPVATTPQVVVATLVSLLPAGSTTAAAGGSAGGADYGSVVYDDGGGAALVSILLASSGQSPCGRGGLTCTTRPDGSQVSAYDDLEYPAQQRGARERSVTLVRDGMTLTLSEWNAPTSKDSPTTRPEPPLDRTQVLAILDDPAWALQVPPAAVASAAPFFVPTTPGG